MRIDLEPLDPELRELLATARGRDADDPAFDSEACERLLARVERQLATGGSTAPSTIAAHLLWPGKLAAACAAVAIAGVIAVSMRGAPKAPVAPAPVVEPVGPSAPEASREMTAPEDDADEASAIAIATISVDELPSTAVRSAPSAAGDTSTAVKKADGVDEHRVDLAGELRSVDTARFAIARHQYADALRLLDEHERRYPSGQLAQERERLRIQALVATGDMAQARSRAAAFRKQHPSGLLVPSVERALEGDQNHDR